MDGLVICISMYGQYSDTYLDYMDNVWIVFGSIFIYYSHCIWIRTLYLHFMHIMQIICVWYSDYSQHYLQRAQTWLPDLIAAPCMELVLFTGSFHLPSSSATPLSLYVSALPLPPWSCPFSSPHLLLLLLPLGHL